MNHKKWGNGHLHTLGLRENGEQVRGRELNKDTDWQEIDMTDERVKLK